MQFRRRFGRRNQLNFHSQRLCAQVDDWRLRTMQRLLKVLFHFYQL